MLRAHGVFMSTTASTRPVAGVKCSMPTLFVAAATRAWLSRPACQVAGFQPRSVQASIVIDGRRRQTRNANLSTPCGGTEPTSTAAGAVPFEVAPDHEAAQGMAHQDGVPARHPGRRAPNGRRRCSGRWKPHATAWAWGWCRVRAGSAPRDGPRPRKSPGRGRPNTTRRARGAAAPGARPLQEPLVDRLEHELILVRSPRAVKPFLASPKLTSRRGQSVCRVRGVSVAEGARCHARPGHRRLRRAGDHH
jgi:hypothetical protein